VVEGVARVQVGPFGEELRAEEARRIAQAVIALASGSGGLGALLLECPAFGLRRLERELADSRVQSGSKVCGAIARVLGLREFRVTIPGVPLDRLGGALELCWSRAPLLFGIPASPSSLTDAAPELSSTLNPTSEYLKEYLKQWHSLGAVFHHGEWVGYSAGHLSLDELLAEVLTCFRGGDRECVVSPEPM
jgi:hypothetical protein